VYVEPLGPAIGKTIRNDSEYMMSVLDLLDDRRQFATQSFVRPDAEDLADAVGRQTPEPEFTAFVRKSCEWEDGV